VLSQQFLTVHALQHLGESDPSHCEYAPLAAATGGAVLCAAPALPPPLRVQAPWPAAPRPLHARTALPARQARAPPRA
jgi:hypothetical protein